MALLLLLYGGYLGVRALVGVDVAEADSHAVLLLRAERVVGWDVEGGLDRAVSGTRWLSLTLAFYYATAHYLVTPLVLGWTWWRRPADYRWARNTLVTATAVALVGYALFPTTPPRLLTGAGLERWGGPWPDVLAATSDVGWWDRAASAPAALADLSNQYAAMPSMHAGWALWCVLVLVRSGRPHLARLASAHLVLTVAVVVGTGNHWILDVVAGLVLVGVVAARPARSSPPGRVPRIVPYGRRDA